MHILFLSVLILVGVQEHNFADPQVFDPVFYGQQNEDLRHAFENDKVRLEKHWLDHGINEGRLAHPNFWSVAYLDRYPDLKNAFGNNYKTAVQHYLEHGKREFRDGQYERRSQWQWTDAQSWDNGIVPRSGEDAVISRDRIVILNTDIDVRFLTIDGTLRCANKNLKLSNLWGMDVNGKDSIGGFHFISFGFIDRGMDSKIHKIFFRSPINKLINEIRSFCKIWGYSPIKMAEIGVLRPFHRTN